MYRDSQSLVLNEVWLSTLCNKSKINLFSIKHLYIIGQIKQKRASCSAQLNMKFKLLIKTKMLQKEFSCFQTLKYCILYIMLIIVKMPTNVRINTAN